MFSSTTLLLWAICANVVLSAPTFVHPLAVLPRADVTGYNASLPNITIFATGGTIAGSASSNTQTIGYQAGAIGIQTLINAVPSILNISNIFGVQVANVGRFSEDLFGYLY